MSEKVRFQVSGVGIIEIKFKPLCAKVKVYFKFSIIKIERMDASEGCAGELSSYDLQKEWMDDHKELKRIRRSHDELSKSLAELIKSLDELSREYLSTHLGRIIAYDKYDKNINKIISEFCY